MATEDTSQLSPLLPKDGNETQKGSDQPHKNKPLTATLNWTGFQGKTLWEWLQLFAVLAIPLILGIATLLFGIQQAHLADLQHEADQKIANQQRLQDQALALDQQRQATLVKYQDDMRDLLLHEGLLTSKPGDEIRVLALTETLSAMRQLDPKRISFLIRFLENAHLNGKDLNIRISYNIVNFSLADLSNIDFTGVNLAGADLSGAYMDGDDMSGTNLYEANLSGAFIDGVNLSGAGLNYAELVNADLNDAHLNKAILYDANLSDANLDKADLNGANLAGADLSGAYMDGDDMSNAQNLTQQQLDQVHTCKGAILPQGLTCHHNIMH